MPGQYRCVLLSVTGISAPVRRRMRAWSWVIAVLCMLCMLDIPLCFSSDDNNETGAAAAKEEAEESPGIATSFVEMFDEATGQNLTVGISKPFIARGASHLIPGKSVHGAIILSDMVVGKIPRNLSTLPTEKLDMIRKVSVRIDNYRELQASLPFELTRWSGGVAGPCPHFPNGHKTERGLTFAHLRIWRDFLYFDPEVLARVDENSTEPAVSSDKVFVAYPNGTLVKNGTPMLPDDVLVVFEDDAFSCVNDTATTLIEELSQMKGVDILYLGWCEGRTARPVPLCSHAYAITRSGAKVLAKYLEPCGRAVDEQFVILVKNNWLRYRRAFQHSYRALRPDYNPWGDKTFGIFRQKKSTLGSINGHRRYRR